MSKLDTMIYEIALPICQNFHILCNNRESKKNRQTIMIEINEDEEREIDNINKSVLKFTRGTETFSVRITDIYCYGEIDLNDEETIEEISKFKFLSYLTHVGLPIYSNYIYDKHICKSPYRYPLWTETWSPLRVFKYAHACLNKPKRILLFNRMVK